MLTTGLLLGGTAAFVLLAWAMYGSSGRRRALLAALSVVLLVVLVWTGMALIRPGSV